MKFGSSGTGDGQFSSPSGVSVDSSGYIYVADTNNNRIQKFNSAGVFQMKFGTSGTGDGQLSGPSEVSVDGNGNIYVSESNNNRIQKFNSAGVFQMKFGSSGTGDGQFNYPQGVSVDSSGSIYVADSSNKRIQIFVLDKVHPSASVNSVTNNAVPTNSPVFSGVATDALSTITSIEYQVDATDGSWSTCLPSDGTLNNLSEGFNCSLSGLSDGLHTVYIRSTDSYTNPNTVGNYGEYTFTVDTALPTGIAQINAGASLTNTTAVTLNLISADSAQMKISNVADFAGASWEDYAETKAHTLTTGDGLKTVYVKFKDLAGNQSETVTPTITLDTTKPTTNITDLGLITNVPDKSPLFYYFTSQTPRIKGTTEALATVHFKYEVEDYTTTANADGKYEINIPELPREQVELTYYAVDLAGNQGKSRTLTLVIGVENFPADEVAVEESGAEEEPTPTDGSEQPTPSTTPTITVYGITVVDADGKTLHNTSIYSVPAKLDRAPRVRPRVNEPFAETI